MTKIDVAGLKIDSVTKGKLLETLTLRIHNNQKTFVTTPYSEFLFHSLQNPKILELLNTADIAVPDGIGIFWASRFLNIPLTLKTYYGKIIQSVWEMVYSGAAILLNPKFIRSAFKEKIPGSELIWDLAKLATQQNLSLYLLGGSANTSELAAKILQQKNEKILTIAGYSSKDSDDLSIIDDIKKAKPDILLVAFGPIKQERWIADHMSELSCKVYIGLGGTFDYIAGKKISPPAFIRSIGLEWLYRLITQPYRIKRIFNAVPGLIHSLILYKVQASLPYRKNVVGVILNNENKILIGLRKFDKKIKKPLPGFWQMPQGGVDAGENYIEAAKRETREETGITSLSYIKTSTEQNHYPWSLGFSHYHKGQEQTLVYFRFTGQENEINTNQPGTAQEFTEFRWVYIHELYNSVHTYRKSLATIVEKDLKDLA